KLGLPLFRYGVLLESGRLHRDRGDLAEAGRLFEEALGLVEHLRGFIGDEGARTSFLQGRASACSDLISVLTADENPEAHRRAFDVVQGAKARTLSDLLAGTARAGSTASMTPELIDAESDLEACYNALLAGGQGLTQTRRKAIHDRTIELETRIRRSRLEADIGPQTWGAHGDGPGIVPIPGDGEQVVEFHFIGQQLVAFVWTDGEMTLITNLPTLDQCRSLLRDWARQLERFNLAARLPGRPVDNLVASADEVLQRIWALIFSPVADHLPGGGELLIIPHGPLNAVPFHALPAPGGRIGERFRISTAAGYAVADSLRRRSGRRQGAVGRSLVVGVADAAAPAVATEAAAVAELLEGSELLLNDEATIDAFRSACQQPVDVAHIACHGIHRARSPMFSSLKLADGWLTAHDVLTGTIDADLVVLSACESGRLNSDRVLNEPVGLARSFLAAGAHAVVVSLWLAHDEATFELMTRFHENLNQGSTPVVALQAARTAVAETNPHPAAWAPFIVHGGLPPEGDR
ncbi:MAG: CHAT domain-containing protein, partial [Acidimicrobiia bacterium]|nr:CHAT domain-containing protein [Acidimicrobiia bacterium]